MKKINHITFCLFILSCFIGCSKTPVTPDPTPTPTPTPAPTGTASAQNTSIAYNQKDTINYQFTNADSVWVDNNKMNNTSGLFITNSLISSTTFNVKAQGKGGNLTLNVTVTVGEDPRITFLKTGSYVCDSTIGRPLNTISWLTVSGGCNTYIFTYAGLTASPGNSEMTTNGPCTSNPGLTTTYAYYFPDIVNLWWHGVTYDQFIMYDGKFFKIHKFGPIIVNGQALNGEYWEFYQRL